MSIILAWVALLCMGGWPISSLGEAHDVGSVSGPPHALCSGPTPHAEWRREEWQRQQPLRSASPTSIIRIAGSDGGQWVAGPACSSSVLLSFGEHGLHLVNADDPGAQAVRLNLDYRSRSCFGAFMGRDGLLRYVHPETLRSPWSELVWHVIDPASGKAIKTELKHFWRHLEAFPRGTSCYHAAAHKVIGLADDHTLVIMDAETLAECCRLDLASSDERTGEHAPVSQLEWSSTGKWLAVQVHSPHQLVVNVMHGIHIHDAECGQRIQSVTVQGCLASMSWSGSLHKLAVCCVHADDSADSSSDDEPGGSATITIMDPVIQTVAVLPPGISSEWGPFWQECCWTPCGTLLLVEYRARSWPQLPNQPDEQGVDILDPCGMKLVFTAAQAMHSISWAVLAPLGTAAKSLAAYMPDLGLQVKFLRAQGEWQVNLKPLAADGSQAGYLTPDGDILLLSPEKPTQSVRLCHLAADTASTRNLHIAGQLCPEKTSLKLLAGQFASFWFDPDRLPLLEIVWTALQPSWSGMYAFAHVHSSRKVMPSLKLVDARESRIIGSWSSADLAQLATEADCRQRPSWHSRMIQDIQDIMWSRTGRHIAVVCYRQAFVLVF